METIYGYIRVSTKDQNEERQKAALHQFPVDKKNVFVDKVSGKDFNRPGYQDLMKILQPKDVVVVASIDRLGRNYNEILEQWRIVTKEKCCYIVVLDMPLLDTRKNQDLIRNSDCRYCSSVAKLCSRNGERFDS